MAPEAQLEWEARAGRLVAAAAFAAGLLPVIGQFLSAPTERREGRENADLLIGVEENADRLLAGTLLQAAGLLLLPVVLWYLYRAIKHRRPEFPRVALVVSVLGPPLLAVFSVVGQIDQINVARDFVESGPIEGVPDDVLEERADDASEDRNATLGWFFLVGQFITAVAFVMIALNAMRTGLMSRFMGTIGIIIGVFYAILFLVGGPQLIQLFWLAAVGFLLLDRWPGGRGPAWESGKAIPWPSAVEQREAAERARAEQLEPGSADGHGDIEAASVDPDTPQEEHPRSKKRKRKRRR